MIEYKSWREFEDSGLLWWINTLLHTFGWAIVLDIGEKGEIFSARPARVKFRGFSEDINTKGYQNLSKYLEDNIKEIKEETFL